MQRTYWIRYFCYRDGQYHFDKVVHRDKDTRPRWHKVYALEKWKSTHKGYATMGANSVYTKAEMIANGWKDFL